MKRFADLSVPGPSNPRRSRLAPLLALVTLSGCVAEMPLDDVDKARHPDNALERDVEPDNLGGLTTSDKAPIAYLGCYEHTRDRQGFEWYGYDKVTHVRHEIASRACTRTIWWERDGTTETDPVDCSECPSIDPESDDFVDPGRFHTVYPPPGPGEREVRVVCQETIREPTFFKSAIGLRVMLTREPWSEPVCRLVALHFSSTLQQHTLDEDYPCDAACVLPEGTELPW